MIINKRTLVWTIINNQDGIMIIYNLKNILIINNHQLDYIIGLKFGIFKIKKGGHWSNLAPLSIDYK